MKSALIFCFLFLYSLSISKSDDRNNYPILSGFKKYSVFKGDSLGISGNPYRRIAGSDSLSSFASLAFRPVSEVSFAPNTLGLPQVSLDLLPFSDLSLYSGSQYGLMYPAAAFTGNIGNDLGLNKGSFYVEFKNSVLSIPKPSRAEAGSFDSFNRKHPIDSSLKKDSVSTKDTLGGSAQANSGVAGADSSTYLFPPNVRLLGGYSLGAETIVGPQCSIDFFLCRYVPLYIGPHLGFMFPTIVPAGNIGYHIGMDIGPFFIEAGNSMFSIANPSGGDPATHFTINYKIGVRIWKIFIKVGASYFQNETLFDDPFFFEIDGQPLTIEIGWKSEIKKWSKIKWPKSRY